MFSFEMLSHDHLKSPGMPQKQQNFNVILLNLSILVIRNVLALTQYTFDQEAFRSPPTCANPRNSHDIFFLVDAGSTISPIAVFCACLSKSHTRQQACRSRK